MSTSSVVCDHKHALGDVTIVSGLRMHKATLALAEASGCPRGGNGIVEVRACSAHAMQAIGRQDDIEV